MSSDRPTLLFVEDDPDLQKLTRDFLLRKGMHVVCAQNGKEALDLMQKKDFDLYLLDVMLPETDGYHLAQHIRSSNQQVPIVFLSALRHVNDKLMAFEHLADDYLTKPFEPRELLARIQVQLRRMQQFNPQPGTEILEAFGFRLHPDAFVGAEMEFKLKRMEARLLEVFIRQHNKILPRQWLLEQVWKKNTEATSASLDVHLHRLRKKLKVLPFINIETIRGIGFVLKWDELQQERWQNRRSNN